MTIYNNLQAYSIGNYVSYTHNVGGVIGVQKYTLKAKANIASNSTVTAFLWDNLTKRTYFVSNETEQDALTLMFGDVSIAQDTGRRIENINSRILLSTNIKPIITPNFTFKSRGVIDDNGEERILNYNFDITSLREDGYSAASHRSEREYYSYFGEVRPIITLVKLQPNHTAIVTFTAVGDMFNSLGSYQSPLINVRFDSNTINIVGGNYITLSNVNAAFNVTGVTGSNILDGNSVKLVISNRNNKYYLNLIPKIYT